jgi:MFS family permease
VVGASLFAVSSFFNAAKRAAIPNLVSSPEHLLNANSLSASTTAATIAIGSALGGAIATFISRDTVFILNAVTFLASAEMIRRVKGETRRRGDAETRRDDETAARRDDDAQARRLANQEPETMAERNHSAMKDESLAPSLAASTRLRVPASLPRRVAASQNLRVAVSDFKDGLRYVSGHHVLSAIFIVAAGWGLGNGVARALYSIFGAQLGVAAASGLVARPTDFGISVLFVAMGLGGVLGAPIARRFNAGSGESLGARMGRSMIFDGCGLVVFSMMPNLWGAGAVLVAREINFAIWWTAQQTIMMSRTDDRFAGRVFASYETLTTLMMVGSMTAAGLAADIYGIRPVAALGGAVVSLSGCLWFVLQRRRRSLERARAAITGD